MFDLVAGGRDLVDIEEFTIFSMIISVSFGKLPHKLFSPSVSMVKVILDPINKASIEIIIIFLRELFILFALGGKKII
jgi:hypothetical protein